MKLNLVQSIILIRHGHRCPLRMFVPIPNLTVKPGFLTPIGMSRAISKGKEIRNVYKDFSINEEDIMVVSSNFPRTIETAYYFLQGFLGYSSQNEATIKEKLEFLYKFKLYRKEKQHDVLIHGYFSYLNPRSQFLFEENNVKLFKEKCLFDKIQVYKDIINKFYPNFESNREVYLLIFMVYDFANCLLKNEITLPSPLTKEFCTDLDPVHALLLEDLYMKDEIIRKLSLHYMMKFLQEKILQRKEKLIFFSTHDINIVALVIGLKFENKGVPDFCDDFRIEILEDQNSKDIFCQCKYNNNILSN